MRSDSGPRLDGYAILAAMALALAACSGTNEVTSSAGGGGEPGAAGEIGGFGSGGGGSSGTVGEGTGGEGGGTEGGGEGGGTGGGGGGEGGGGGPETPVDDTQCIDLDGDLHGYLCVAGADCDDGNPNFTTECPDCAQANYAGCPCIDDGANALCFSGDVDLVGIGACTVGNRTCAGGFWSACVGEVPPSEEVCDGADNDCDGSVDEGVKSECGNCDKFCHLYDAGPGTVEPFDAKPDNSEAVEITPEGWVTLSESSYNMHFIWIANSGEHTVSKLDTDTGKELGRYYVCQDPSRTSVDKNGDCWVACRGDGKVGKITNAVEKCADKNGNGVIDTSTDANGDGTISPDEMTAKGEDECVRFVVKPTDDSLARALGVDADNFAWVGMWNTSKLVRLAPEDGKLVKTIDLPNNPYGLAVDQKGVIWVSGRGGNKLVRVDPKTGDVTSLAPGFGCLEPYGIAVDEFGGVWVANAWCDDVAWRYDPQSGTWGSVATKGTPRGIASNGKGSMFVANDDSSAIAKVDIATMKTVGYADLGGGRFPVGVAVDSTGYVWAVNQQASSAQKIDPTTLKVLLEQPVGNSPYTYSDMTGQFFFQSIAPEGYYRTTYGGWEGFRVQWEELSVDYTAPPGTYIKVRVRSAASKDELVTANWSPYVGPFPPATFPVDLVPLLEKKASYLEVEVSLYSESDEVKPYVKGIEITYTAEPQ